MNGQDAKAVCDFFTAASALLAALHWLRASSQPVGVPIAGIWGDSDLAEEMRQDAPKILRGAKLNRVAALLTGVSALFQFLSWIVPRLWH
jgi:hypothetical protein